MNNENTILVMKNIFEENDRVAKETNLLLSKKNIFAVNVLGAPGIGKTTLITNIIKGLNGIKSYVIEGDIKSDIDTQKLKSIGIEAFQINTNGACHLDSLVIKSAIDGMNLVQEGVLFIENIGNLVCPAEFFIGEHIKLLITSVTDGSDKPYKYPLAFENADVIIVNKKDLLPYVDFDMDYFLAGVRGLNKKAPVFLVSNKSENECAEVIIWIKEKITIMKP